MGRLWAKRHAHSHVGGPCAMRCAAQYRAVLQVLQYVELRGMRRGSVGEGSVPRAIGPPPDRRPQYSCTRI